MGAWAGAKPWLDQTEYQRRRACTAARLPGLRQPDSGHVTGGHSGLGAHTHHPAPPLPPSSPCPRLNRKYKVRGKGGGGATAGGNKPAQAAGRETRAATHTAHRCCCCCCCFCCCTVRHPSSRPLGALLLHECVQALSMLSVTPMCFPPSGQLAYLPYPAGPNVCNLLPCHPDLHPPCHGHFSGGRRQRMPLLPAGGRGKARVGGWVGGWLASGRSEGGSGEAQGPTLSFPYFPPVAAHSYGGCAGCRARAHHCRLALAAFSRWLAIPCAHLLPTHAHTTRPLQCAQFHPLDAFEEDRRSCR